MMLVVYIKGALSASAVFMVTELIVLNAFYVNITATERLIKIVLLSSTHSKNNIKII